MVGRGDSDTIMRDPRGVVVSVVDSLEATGTRVDSVEEVAVETSC